MCGGAKPAAHLILRTGNFGMPSWYYTVNGEQLGPVEESAIRKLAAGRGISPEDLVWRDGMPEWISAADAGFFGGGPPVLSVAPVGAVAVAPAPVVPLTYA